MPKILRQNVGGIDYAMAGCALSGSCTTAASDFVKVVTLSDGDTVSDGMSLAVAFTNGNTAGNAPGTTTIYSSDQVHYFSDSGLTQPFTLAPAGCHTITYTGTGNAYTYKSFPVLSVGGVTAPVCSVNGRNIGTSAWNAGDIGVFIYPAGKFLLVSVNLDNTTGVLPIAHGGTGATTGGGACTNLIGALTVATGDVTDNTDVITSNADGYAEQSDKQFYKRKGIKFWNYIKGKIGNVIKAVSANGFWGMADPNGADNVWIRTTNQGIIPYQGGNKGSGHQYIGTSTWYFSHGYFDNLHSVNVETDTVTANGYQLKRYYAIDASGLSASNFYPVTFYPSDLELDCEIHSPNLGGGDPYNQNHIHFLLTWQGWSDTPKRFVILSYGVYDANEITIGCIGTGNQNGANCIWVRGGRLYRFYCNRTPTLHTADWSYGNEKFTVGTSQSGGTNANVTVSFKPSDYTAYGSFFKDAVYAQVPFLRDSGNGQNITASYSKAGLSNWPLWLAAWNGYEIGSVSTGKICRAFRQSTSDIADGNSCYQFCIRDRSIVVICIIAGHADYSQSFTFSNAFSVHTMAFASKPNNATVSITNTGITVTLPTVWTAYQCVIAGTLA